MPESKRSADLFQFKNFAIRQDRCAMKVNTDGILLGAWAPLVKKTKVKALDIGTGTGLIALLLAERMAAAEVMAVEVDAAAARQARENIAASPYAGQLRVYDQSIQAFVAELSALDSDLLGGVDLIVSNPPFFSGGVLSEQENRAAARHTLKLSHGDLLSAVRELLAPGGQFAVILPLIEGLRFIDLATTTYGLHLQQQLSIRPRTGRPVHRLLLSFSNRPAEVQKEELIHYGEGESWTKEFRKLVGDFYQSPK